MLICYLCVVFQSQAMFTLFEHASGYGLFRVKEFEEVGMLLPAVEDAVRDLSKFNSVVKLIAFSPFKSGTNALDNINSISEGNLTLSNHVVLISQFNSELCNSFVSINTLWDYQTSPTGIYCRENNMPGN